MEHSAALKNSHRHNKAIAVAMCGIEDSTVAMGVSSILRVGEAHYAGGFSPIIFLKM